jgi:ornithine lipid ester-linked acyl 2-hydroxylase
MFYDNLDFQFTNFLQSNWLVIKEELTRLQERNFISWHEKFLYNQGWNVFGLYAFEKKIEDNCRLCPQTTELLESIPGMTTAGFSSLAPGTHIHPHVGYTTTVLRCHLGLIVPDDCGIRVGNTVEHEAWNHSKLPRILLLIDFKKQALQNWDMIMRKTVFIT